MEDDKKASAVAGSAEGASGSGSAGEAAIDLDKYVPKEQYESLEGKLGEQGEELGKLRGYFNDTHEFIRLFDDAPKLVDAIVTGKVNEDLAQKIIDGKVTIAEAEKVQEKAHEEVKKDMGDKKFKDADPELIASLVAEKVAEQIKPVKEEVKGEIESFKELQAEEKKLEEFVKETEDFEDYAEDIIEYYKEHEEADIETAYHVVKGRALAKKAAEDKQKRETEEAKNAAARPSSGQGSRTGVIEDEDMIEKFISVPKDPNQIF